MSAQRALPTAPYPVSAEAKGKLRLWKAAASAGCAQIDRAISSGRLAQLGDGLARRRLEAERKRMVRAAGNLLGPAAHLEAASLKGKAPHLLYTVLRPRDSGLIDRVDPSDDQLVVAVEYLVVGVSARSDGWAKGLWTMEIPDHALHRIYQREPRADLTQVLLDGHRNALLLRVEQLRPYNSACGHQGFLLKAGPGALVTLLWHNGAGQHYLRPETWLSDDALAPGRVVLAPDGEPGERMAHRLLRPSALGEGATPESAYDRLMLAQK
jgi:hypothetical protein